MDQETLGRELQKFNVTDAAIAELSKQYLVLKVNGLDDKDGLAMVHKARMDVKNRRISVEKTRKELKEDALRYGQAIDREAKRITALLAPIEEHLDAEEGKIQAEKDRIKAEADAKEAARLQARIDTICAFGAIFNGQTYTAYGLQIPAAIVKACTDDQFNQFVAQVQAKKAAEEARLKAEEEARKAEAERIAKVQAEQEAERQRLAEIARKQAEEAAAIRAEHEAAERKVREEREALEAEKQRLADAEAARLKAIEDEKRKAAEAKALAERIERERKEAAEKAIRDAAEKAEREAKEKAAREEAARIAAEKKAARMPDKAKLLALAVQVGAMEFPCMKTEEGKKVLESFKSDLSDALHDLKGNAENL